MLTWTWLVSTCIPGYSRTFYLQIRFFTFRKMTIFQSKIDFLSTNSRCAIQNDGTFLPRITRETCTLFFSDHDLQLITKRAQIYNQGDLQLNRRYWLLLPHLLSLAVSKQQLFLSNWCVTFSLLSRAIRANTSWLAIHSYSLHRAWRASAYQMVSLFTKLGRQKLAIENRIIHFVPI